MKKLYVVDVSHTVYVLAEDDEEAEKEALRGIHDYGDQPEVDVSVVKKGEPVPKDWLDSLPFGDAEGKFIRQIVSELP